MVTFNQLINAANESLEAITTPEPKIQVKRNKKLCECGKALPSFNYPNIKKGICCNSCKKPGMVSNKKKMFLWKSYSSL